MNKYALRLGEAEATGLPRAYYDVAVLSHVLAHNGGREQAIMDHLVDADGYPGSAPSRHVPFHRDPHPPSGRATG